MKSSSQKLVIVGAFVSLCLLIFWPAPPRYSRDPPATDGCSAPRSGFVVSKSRICLDLDDSPYFDVRVNPDDPDSNFGHTYQVIWDNAELLEERYAFPLATRRVRLVAGQIVNNAARKNATTSDLPNLQRYEFASREYLFTDDEKGFDLFCRQSLSSRLADLGGEECEVSFQLDPYLLVRVSYGTFQWSGEPGWPALDTNWATELAPVFQAAREAAAALIQIQ